MSNVIVTFYVTCVVGQQSEMRLAPFVVAHSGRASAEPEVAECTTPSEQIMLFLRWCVIPQHLRRWTDDSPMPDRCLDDRKGQPGQSDQIDL